MSTKGFGYILFFFIVFQSSLFAKDLPTCYSVQLLSSKKKIIPTKKYPSTSKVFFIHGIYTLRDGCFDSMKEAKKHYKKLKKQFKNSILVSTYKFRFKKDYLHSENKLTLDAKNMQQRSSAEKKCLKKPQQYPWELIHSKELQSVIDTNEFKTFTPPKIFQDKREYTQKNFKVSNNIFYFYINPYVAFYQGQESTDKPKLQGDIEKITLGMQWLYRINPYWNFYTDTRLISYRNYKNSLEKKDFVLDIKELYLQSDLLFQNQANLLIGRKNIYDSRSWYYHAPLDTLKIFNKHDLFLYELYAGTRLNSNIVIEGTSSSNKHNLKNIKFVIAHLSYEYFKANKTEFFGIYENTDTIEQRELYWLGLRFIGYLPFSQYNLQYWLDLSKVQGDINKEIFPNDIDGYAYDIGFKYTFNSLSDMVAFSYAYGSGGNKLYTQPYLTNNKSDFLQRHLYFRHYGSFLDPELSNMKIASLYYSHLFQNKQSFLIALHNYKQDTASYIQYFTSRFTLQPNGKSTDIGNEIDCIYGIYYQKEYDLRTIFSYFFGGNAFDTVTTKKDGLYGQINFRYFW